MFFTSKPTAAKSALGAAAALLATTAIAQAGGVERSSQSMAILFEEGTYAEFSVAHVSPSVSGVFPGSGANSGDMLESYTDFALRYRRDLTDSLSFAMIFDQPIGADVAYPAGTFYPLGGTTAALDSHALTAVLRYELPSGFSVYGGLSAVQLDGQVDNLPIPGFGFYSLEADGSAEIGGLVGVAYEIPEIAFRVAATYRTSTAHDVTSSESIGSSSFPGNFEIEIPQSFTLEAQSGIAEDTLLFGSIRWVDWTAFTIDPPNYPPPTPLVGYQDDRVTYTLGLGRRFNDMWSGAVTVVHEPSNGNITGNLAPTDGRSGVGLAASWTNGQVDVTGGIQYSWLGDATTQSIGANFTDNSSVAVGLRVGFQF